MRTAWLFWRKDVPYGDRLLITADRWFDARRYAVSRLGPAEDLAFEMDPAPEKEFGVVRVELRWVGNGYTASLRLQFREPTQPWEYL